MRRSVIIVTTAACFLAGGCAAVTPWQEQLKSYPLIQLGDPKPADGKYVVHMPAGKPVATKVFIEGDIFRENVMQEVYATPRRDVYFYEDWISFDMKNWSRTRSTLDIEWDVGMPGHKNPVPGFFKIKVNEQQ